MTDRVTIKVEGLQELGESLRLLSRETATKITRSMTNAAAQLVRKDAVARAPEYTEPHMVDGVLVNPGNLKKNIVVKRWTKTRLTSEHLVTVRGKRKDGFAARYGRLVEFGTVKMAAQPFLRPALQQNVRAASEAMRENGKKGLTKAIGIIKPKRARKVKV